MFDDSSRWRRFAEGRGLIITVAVLVLLLGIAVAIVLRSKSMGI